MLFFVKVRVMTEGLSVDQMWEMWDKEADVAIGAMKAGKIVAAYKVAGQRRVVGIVEVESHHELDAIFMAGLPMAHHLEIEEVLPVREYARFAEDVKRRWT